MSSPDLPEHSRYSESDLETAIIDALAEITLPEDKKSIFASRYKTILTGKQEFIRLLKEYELP